MSAPEASIGSLADALKAAIVERDARCPVRRLLDTLPPEDAETLATSLLLPRERLPDKRIIDVLRAHGHGIGKDSVSTHRRGQCTCPSQTT